MTIYRELDRTSHGYLILQSIDGPTQDALSTPDYGWILCVREGNTFQPFVVWEYNTASGSTYTGGYYATLSEAMEDFESRSRR